MQSPITKDHRLTLSVTNDPRGGFIIREMKSEEEGVTEQSDLFKTSTVPLTLPRLTLSRYLSLEKDITETLRPFGRQLFKFLFPGLLGDRYYRWKKEQHSTSQECELVLQMDVNQNADLVDMPWEIMHDGKDFMALSGLGVSIIRSPLVIREDQIIARSLDDLNILVVISNPVDFDIVGPLASESEVQAILKTIESRPSRGKIHVHLLDGASPATLQVKLKELKPQLLHFIGHGTFNQYEGFCRIIMEDKENYGKSLSVPSPELAEILLSCDTLETVVLNACYTGAAPPHASEIGLAWHLIANRGCTVVAMRSSVADSFAIEFSKVFYEGIMAGYTIPQAVTKARIHLAVKTDDPNPSFGVPVVLQSTVEPVRLSQCEKREGQPLRSMIHFGNSRDKELYQLFKLLQEKDCKTILLLGPRGVGKSTFIRKAMQLLCQRHAFASMISLVVKLHNSSEAKKHLSEQIDQKPAPAIIHIELSYENTVPNTIFQSFNEIRRPFDVLIFEGIFDPPYPEECNIFIVPELSIIQAIRCVHEISDLGGLEHVLDVASIVGGNPELIQQVFKLRKKYGHNSDHNTLVLADQALSEFGLKEAFWQLPKQARWLVRLLAVFRTYIFRPLAEELFPGLLSILGTEIGHMFDILLGHGWLTVADPTRGQYIMVPRWIRVPILSEYPPEELRPLHLAAGQYFEQAKKKMPFLMASENKAYHYDAANEHIVAFLERFGSVDDLSMQNPDIAVALCEKLIEAIPLSAELAQVQLLLVASLESALGNSYRKMSQHDKAESCYISAIAKACRGLRSGQMSQDTRSRIKLVIADCLLAIAEHDSQNGKVDTAKVFVLEAHRIYSSLDEQGGLSRCSSTLSNIAGQKGDLSEAIQLSRHAVDLARRDKHTNILSGALLHLARQLFKENPDSKEAKELCSNAIDCALDPIDRANACLYLAQMYRDSDSFSDKSLHLFEEARKLYQRVGYTAGVAYCYRERALLFLKYVEIAEACQSMTEAIIEFLRSGMNREAEICRETVIFSIPEVIRLGESFFSSGNLDDAFKYYEIAASCAAVVEMEREIKEAQFRLAIISLEKHKFVDALNRFHSLRNISLAEGDWLYATESLHEIGVIHLMENRLSEAREMFTQCLREKQEHQDRKAMSPTLQMLSETYRVEGNVEKAEELLIRCVKIEREASDERGIAESLAGLANIKYKQNKYEEAKSLASESLKLSEKFSLSRFIVMNLFVLGKVSIKQAKPKCAETFFQRAIRLARQIDMKELPLIEKEWEELRTPNDI